MAYWWVSHNQKHKAEIQGGYIWCPQRTSHGKARTTWTNVSKVQKGDLIFSYARGKIQAIGLAQSNAQDAKAPVGYTAWRNSGWRVSVEWSLLESPFSPKDHWPTIAHLFPTHDSPMRTDGDGNLTYLAQIDPPLAMQLLAIAEAESPLAIDEVNEKSIAVLSPVSVTEKKRLQLARVGQGLFRSRVIEIEKKCRVTGISDVDFLIASHIKPWQPSDNQERLDGNNGLLLAPHVDKLFDRGWISFSDAGSILCNHMHVVQVMQAWGISPQANVGPFSAAQRPYLHYHRNNVLKA